MQDHYSDPADRERQEIYIAAEAALDELDVKEEQRANWFQMAQKLGEDLDAAERRVAELDQRLIEYAGIATREARRVAELEDENEYVRWRFKESDLLFAMLLITMRAAVIEKEHGEGDRAAMDWIINKLAGPGEFAPESETDAQAYFNRESEIIDSEFSACMDFFMKRNERLRAAGIKVKGE
ncbi:ead/Ea22-like family protein [Salmonella enterica]|nr:ead/Ea22-like family protein [Salmonella enterica]